MRGLVGDRFGLMLAFAFPAVLANMIVGQNGFVTAALVGGTVGLMQRRPVLAGICLGLLTYKPQFGVLFPVVLIAARQWTVFVTAAAVGAALAAASWLLFGSAAWEQFFHWLPVSSQAFLSEGQSDWAKLQSFYGLVRTAGGGEPLGWALQAAAAIAAAAGLCVLWRSRAPFEMKAAALATGTLLATPYVYMYDMVVLAIPVALLVRAALTSGWTPAETYGLPVAAALLIAFAFVKLPVGLAATLIVMSLVVGRAIKPSVVRAAQPSQ